MGKMLTAVLVCLLCCSGCGRGEDPWRVDTVVRIPMDTAEETSAGEGTVPVTEPTEWIRPTFPGLELVITVPLPTSEPEKSEEPPRREPDLETAAAETEPEAAKCTVYTLPRYTGGELEAELLNHINALRKAAGAAALSVDDALSELARVRCREASEAFSHTRPDGRDYATVLTDYGYEGTALGELLTYITAYEDPGAVVDIWAEREASLLSDGCTGIGIGTFRENGYTLICVLLTGK